MTMLVEPDACLDAERPREHRRTLLLIDDDMMMGRFLADAADECGCTAAREPTMARFQRSYHEACPDIVAVDLSATRHNGGEVLSFLAAERYCGRVLILSGLDHRKLDAALRLGASARLNVLEPLAKPFRIDELARRLAVETEPR